MTTVCVCVCVCVCVIVLLQPSIVNVLFKTFITTLCCYIFRIADFIVTQLLLQGPAYQ
jgi:hypothetical protein